MKPTGFSQNEILPALPNAKKKKKEEKKKADQTKLSFHKRLVKGRRRYYPNDLIKHTLTLNHKNPIPPKTPYCSIFPLKKFFFLPPLLSKKS